VRDFLDFFCNYLPCGVMQPTIEYKVSELYYSDRITKHTEHLFGLLLLYCGFYRSRDKDI